MTSSCIFKEPEIFFDFPISTFCFLNLCFASPSVLDPVIPILEHLILEGHESPFVLPPRFHRVLPGRHGLNHHTYAELPELFAEQPAYPAGVKHVSRDNQPLDMVRTHPIPDRERLFV